MNSTDMEKLHTLLEAIETSEGFCYQNRTACSAACPLWYAGAFGGDVCLPRVLGHRMVRLIRDKRLREQEKEGVSHGKDEKTSQG